MDWQIPPRKIAPSADHIDLWRGRLDVPDALAEKFTSILSDDERVRADRYIIASKRRQFIVGRGLLRQTLGLMLDANPRSLTFAYGAAGKPSLADEEHVQFNVSHSGEIILIAVGLNRSIGVDLEEIRPRPNLEAMAERFFAPEETSELMALPDTQREEAFFHCWCRKEAVLKGAGVGISIGLNRFAVNTSPNEPPRLIRVDWDKEIPTDWRLDQLAVADGYAAGLAYTGSPVALRAWDRGTVPTPPSDARGEP